MRRAAVSPVYSLPALSACRWRSVAGNAARKREAAIRRHARDRHGLRRRCRRCRGIRHDWNWKHNHDTGQFYEQLFAADLSKAKQQRRQVSVHTPTPGCRPTAIRGELAESWEWKENPLQRRDQAAQGRDVSGQARRDGVARAHRRRRRLQLSTASTRARRRSTAYFDSRRQGRGDRQVHRRVHLKEYNAEWDYRFGWGYYSGIMPEGSRRRRRRQLEERQRHRPVHADRLRAGQFQHLHQEPDLLGQGEDRRHRSTSCRSSTRSSIAPSRTRRRC